MGRLAKRRDREDGKNSLHTDKPEIHKRAGEKWPFVVKDFLSRTKPPHGKPTTGLFLRSFRNTSKCCVHHLHATLPWWYLLGCLSLSAWTQFHHTPTTTFWVCKLDQQLFFESNTVKDFFTFPQSKRYLRYLKPQQPLLGSYMNCCDHTGANHLLHLQEWIRHALSTSIAAGMENKMKQGGSIKSKSTSWLASGRSAMKSGDSPIFH